ncbi:MAG: class III extradiol ring-cleavage dioxygenase [Desulfobacterales bacterium]|jgi:4,5-DOPA dioxygenase extradiol
MSAQTPKMPVLFVSHGMPTMVETPVPTRRFLQQLGEQIPRPVSILCISAHFEAWLPMVTGAGSPETIHDFYGFPAFMYEKQYPAPGDPALARAVTQRLADAGIEARLDENRGLDHGAWVPLMLMYPEAAIPVVQLSIQTEKGPGHHVELGRALAPLRRQGVLLLASGGATHNLTEMRSHRQDDPPAPYAAAFDAWLEDALCNGKTETLIEYENRAPEARRNHPYPAEHFLPLFVSLGAAGRHASAKRLHSAFLYGVLSMAAYAWE